MYRFFFKFLLKSMWGAMPYVGLQSTRYMYYLDQTLQLKRKPNIFYRSGIQVGYTTAIIWLY